MAAEKTKKAKRFQLSGRHLYLTYPRCQADPKAVNDKIVESLDPEWSITCREQHEPDEYHEDGEELHIHCVLRLKRKRNWSSQSCLDYLTGQHGNYQICRNVRDVVKYVTKGDQFVEHGVRATDFLESARKRQRCVDTKGTQVCRIIDEGGTLEDVRKMDPGFFMHNMRKIKEYTSYLDNLKGLQDKEDWTEIVMQHNFPAEEKIITWLNLNIKKERPFKQAQLWVHGVKNTGKTQLIMWLEKHLRVYHIPRNGWDDMYNDRDYDVAVIDEFKGTKTITWMNLFCQGGATPLQRRGIPDYIKRKNIPIIVLSNMDILGAYPNSDEVMLEALKYRFLEVEIPWDQTIRFHMGKEDLARIGKEFKERRSGNRKDVGIWKSNGEKGPIIAYEHGPTTPIDIDAVMGNARDVYNKICN